MKSQQDPRLLSTLQSGTWFSETNLFKFIDSQVKAPDVTAVNM